MFGKYLKLLSPSYKESLVAVNFIKGRDWRQEEWIMNHDFLSFLFKVDISVILRASKIASW